MNTSTTLPESTDVLIVGAGPTGLALAIALGQAGVGHVLIDKLPQGLNTSRAGVIHAHTLEALDGLGVSNELERRGLKVSNFTIRDRDRPLVELHFDRLPSKYPHLLMLPQDVTESVLTSRLEALGGSIHRNVTATSLVQDAGSVRVWTESPAGPDAIRARFVVGADGMHSLVRTAAEVDFEGGTYAESFILADVRMEWAFANREVSLFFSPDGMVVVAPLPDGSFRVVATVEAAPEHPVLADIQSLIDTRGPATGVNRVLEVVWSSRFRLHHRVARRYRNGRLLLMGDAAHVHSPAGGQGMNTGLVDAVVLGRLLSDVVHQRRPESSLDLYQHLRRPAAAKVLGLAGGLTGMATLRGPIRQGLRNILLSVVNHLPPAKRRVMMNLSGLSRRSYSVVPPQTIAVRRSPAAEGVQI